jgi:hypothetical protein
MYCTREAVQIILRKLKDLHSQLRTKPRVFVVRFPWPLAYESALGIQLSEFGPIRELLEDPSLPFKVCRVHLQPGQDPTRLSDKDTVDDTGWRVGTMFLPSDDEELDMG